MYLVAEQIVNSLAMMLPNETTDDGVPESAVTSAWAPWPLLRSSACPVPESVAVLPLLLASGQVPRARSNSPCRYHAETPPGKKVGGRIHAVSPAYVQ